MRYRGTGLGRLSESFQKELPDIDLTRGRIRSIGFTLPGQKTTIRLFFALRSLAVQKTVGYSSVGHSSLVGELWRTGKYNDTAPEIVQRAQLPALFVVVIKECWDVKNAIRNRLGRRSGQMVVKRYKCATNAQITPLIYNPYNQLRNADPKAWSWPDKKAIKCHITK